MAANKQANKPVLLSISQQRAQLDARYSAIMDRLNSFNASQERRATDMVILGMNQALVIQAKAVERLEELTEDNEQQRLVAN